MTVRLLLLCGQQTRGQSGAVGFRHRSTKSDDGTRWPRLMRKGSGRPSRHGRPSPQSSGMRTMEPGPSVACVPRRPVFVYRREFEFPLPPEELWERLENVDQFERWWPWLREFRLEGDTLATGSVLHGVVVPPLPYRMRIRVELTRCEPPDRIDADIGGDLEGGARLDLRPDGAGSRVEVAWAVEMMQRPMRLASRFGWPLLQWGHDRVVESTVAGFRRRLEAADT